MAIIAASAPLTLPSPRVRGEGLSCSPTGNTPSPRTRGEGWGEGFIGAALALLASNGYAQTGASPQPLGVASLLQVGGGLIVVLLALAGCMFLLRRMTALRGANGTHLRVIEAIALGARERIVLLDVDGERVLIGVSAGRIQPLAALKPAVAASFEGELQKSFAELEEVAR